MKWRRWLYGVGVWAMFFTGLMGYRHAERLTVESFLFFAAAYAAMSLQHSRGMDAARARQTGG